jgi:hypothetical protein
VTQKKSKESSAKQAGERTQPIGVSLTQYTSARKLSKHKAGQYRDSDPGNFPAPIAIVGGVRRIHYYNEKELETYFTAAEGFNNKTKKEASVTSATLQHKFITTAWIGQEIPTRCTLAEDSYLEP